MGLLTWISCLKPFVKPSVKHVSVIVNNDVKLDKQINLVIKSIFFQLKQLSKIISFLSSKDFERSIHMFISSRLDCCNGLYVSISQASLARLQMVQNTAAHLLTGTYYYHFGLSSLAS